MRTRNKRPYTLFEMLIVMALIALTFGAVGFYIPQALKKESFEKSVSHVISKLSLAQEVMLDYQMDITLVLETKNEGLEVSLQPAIETSQRLKKSLNRHQMIEGIQKMAFNGEEKERVELKFEGKTGQISKGTLELFAKQHSSSIMLKGFPSKIQQGVFQENEIKAAYPEEILSAI